jgi:hypothetical protein
MAQNYRVDRYSLRRPEHLDEATWAAIESYRQRVETAAASGDRPAAVGPAKEFVECLARSVLLVLGTTLGDDAKFPKVVDTAQATLGMRPGQPGIKSGVRVIAQSANTMVQKVNEVHNDVGTGHGRGGCQKSTTRCSTLSLMPRSQGLKDERIASRVS